MPGIVRATSNACMRARPLRAACHLPDEGIPVGCACSGDGPARPPLAQAGTHVRIPRPLSHAPPVLLPMHRDLPNSKQDLIEIPKNLLIPKPQNEPS